MLRFPFGPNRFLGVDIGTTAIKLSEIHFHNGVFHLAAYGILTNYGHLERVNDAIQTSSFKIVEDNTSKLLEMVIKKSKINVNNVVMSIPAFSSFTTAIDFPMIPAKEIAQAIPFQAKQYVPIPISEVVLDWQIIEEAPGRLQVLLIAVPKDIINRYVKLAKLARLNINAIELESISLARCLMSNDPTPTVIVDIGGRVTSFTIVDKTTVRLTTSIDSGGGDLTQVISSGLSIDPFRAEEIKKAYGLKPPPGQEVVANMMMPMLDVIRTEAERTMAIYTRKTGQAVSQMIVTGGSANMPGLIEYYAKDMKIKVIKGDPFELGYISYSAQLAPVIKDIGSSLAVACGLGVRGLKY